MKQLQFDFSGNLGGISRMFAIPVSSYKRLRRDHTHGLNFLEVINRSDIIDIYLTDDSGDFKDTEKGGVHVIELSGIVPKSNPLNNVQLMTLMTEYWYVLFQDNNDFVRLAGTEENQLIFTRTDSTGQMTSRNQIEFLFSGMQTEPCAFIELVEMDDL